MTTDITTDYSDTSVRWLREKFPIYVAGASHRSFPDQLSDALWKMKFDYVHVVEGTCTKETWRAMLRTMSLEWTRKGHLEMVAFLEAGGYKETHSPSETVMVSGPDGDEFIDILMEEVDMLRPPSQMSPQHELEEIVADAALAADPRLGAW